MGSDKNANKESQKKSQKKSLPTSEQIIAVIPSRYGSTRLPGKPLLKILGKELLAWVIEGVKQSKLLDSIIVATDDARIADLAQSLGVEAVMTSADLASGTDRIWAAARDRQFSLAVNIQGDEPMVNGSLIDSLVAPMMEHPEWEMGTIAHPMDVADLPNPNAVKVICNQRNEAIYFSRFGIPYSRQIAPSVNLACLKHIGMYCYRRSFLQKFCAQPPGLLEQGEALEQLRALEMGAKIFVQRVEQKPWGVDTPEDLKKIEEFLGRKNG